MFSLTNLIEDDVSRYSEHLSSSEYDPAEDHADLTITARPASPLSNYSTGDNSPSRADSYSPPMTTANLPGQSHSVELEMLLGFVESVAYGSSAGENSNGGDIGVDSATDVADSVFTDEDVNHHTQKQPETNSNCRSSAHQANEFREEYFQRLSIFTKIPSKPKRKDYEYWKSIIATGFYSHVDCKVALFYATELIVNAQKEMAELGCAIPPTTVGEPSMKDIYTRGLLTGMPLTVTDWARVDEDLLSRMSVMAVQSGLLQAFAALLSLRASRRYS